MFEENRLETIMDTQSKLKQNEYQQLVFSCFSIIERGKPRDIRACHINDRLVQNALCDSVLIPELTPKFIYDNCATLKNKGVDFALMRIKTHLQKANTIYGGDKDFYGLRIDIRKYFDSIDHKMLSETVHKILSDNQICNLVDYIISTFSFKLTKDQAPIPGKAYYYTKESKYIKMKEPRFLPNRKYYEYDEKSLGLGSQTSQLLALLALNEIDHYVKEKLHVKLYGRYMDDIYLISDDKEYLLQCKTLIGEKLSEIGLSMNEKKSHITRIHPIQEDGVRRQPFKYLKWNFYITKTGRIIQLPYKTKIYHQRRKLRKMQQLWTSGKITTEDVLQSYKGWRAHIAKGNTYHILQKMDNYFCSLFKGVELT